MENIKGEEYRIETPSLLHTTNHDWQFVYEPAEDTFLMLDALEKDLNCIMCKKPRICLEVGSGSGVIITALRKSLGCTAHCLAIDVNEYACQLTKRTSTHNNVPVDVINGDLTSCLREFVVDLILFNPPYVVTTSEEVKNGDCLTKSWAGGIKGREIIDRFLERVDRILDPNGFGYILLLRENDPQEIITFLSRKNFSANVLASRKLRGEELYIVKFQNIT